MIKKQLRENAVQLLKNTTQDEQEEISGRIAGHLFSTAYWQKASSIGITLSRKHEWNTEPIIKQAWKENKKVAVPKCFPLIPEMKFYEIHTWEQLEQVYLDLREPDPKKTKEIAREQLELMIVPGLMFDWQGYRIGYGGGYYDRFLAGFPHQTIAIASQKQMTEYIPADYFDIPVQHLITENGLVF